MLDKDGKPDIEKISPNVQNHRRDIRYKYAIISR